MRKAAAGQRAHQAAARDRACTLLRMLPDRDFAIVDRLIRLLLTPNKPAQLRARVGVPQRSAARSVALALNVLTLLSVG